MDQAEAEQNSRTDRQPPLERMAARTRAAASADNAAFDGAIRVAFGRMARTRRGLDAAVTSVKMSPASLAEVVEIVEPGMFLSLLEGEGDRIGLAVMCHSLMAGLVEAVTTARVADAPPNPRKPTRTDAALLAPLLDILFQHIAQRLAVAGGAAAQFDGYVYGSFLDDPRPLGVLLEDVPYQMLRLRVQFGDGPREGDMYLVLPDVAQAQGATGPAQDTTRQAQWTAQLEATVCTAEVQLDAVLCRMQMKLSAVSTLKRGDVLCLPESALEALSLETLKGHVVAKARLGQARGQRAVRLTSQPGEAPEDYDVPFTLPVSAARILPAGPFDTGGDDAGYDTGVDTDTDSEMDTDMHGFAMPDDLPMQTMAEDIAAMPDAPTDGQ